jgi:hypothetical protein
MHFNEDSAFANVDESQLESARELYANIEQPKPAQTGPHHPRWLLA